MRLTFVIPFAFAICSALVSASASKFFHPYATIPLRSDAHPPPRPAQVVSRGLPESCGPTSQVLAHTTIDHQTDTLDFVTGTCIGGSSGDSTKRSDLEGRQQVCTNGFCEGDTTYPPWGQCLTCDN